MPKPDGMGNHGYVWEDDTRTRNHVFQYLKHNLNLESLKNNLCHIVSQSPHGEYNFFIF